MGIRFRVEAIFVFIIMFMLNRKLDAVKFPFIYSEYINRESEF